MKAPEELPLGYCRRDFLKFIGLGAAGFVAETSIIVPFIYQRIAEFARGEGLPLLKAIPPGSVAFGVAPHDNDPHEATRISEILSKDIQIVNLFSGSTGSFSEDMKMRVGLIVDADKVPMLSWYPVDPVHPDRMKFASMYAYEADIRKGARQLGALEKKVLFRPLYEMNGNWFGWHEQNRPEEWVKFWRFLHKIYKEEGATNIRFVFSPNVTLNNVRPIQAFYPGNEYVDFTSLDAYDRYSSILVNPRHIIVPNLSPEYVLGPDLLTLTRLAPHKPFLLSEINSQREFGRAPWVEGAIRYTVTHMPNTAGVISFEWNLQSKGMWEQDWRMTSDPTLLSMYQKLLKEPWFFQGANTYSMI